MGGEDKGITPSAMAECDFLCAIAMKGQTNSLNVSVAAGIAMNQLG